MDTLLELTYFVGDSRNGEDENMDTLLDVMTSGVILPQEDSHFVEPSEQAIEMLGESGYGIGFAPDFLEREASRFDEGWDNAVLPEAANAPTRILRIWKDSQPIHFSVSDVQTIYVRDSQQVMTLRIAFPRYAGTFVIL